MENGIQKYTLHISWIVALTATLGSLYFSEILHLVPCVLCWYERIAMYPLVILLLIGIIRRHKDIWLTVLPFSVIGMAIALYHNLLYYHLLPESFAPCTAGISCTTRLIEWLGFITIPLLSLLAFTIITICMLVAKKYNQEKSPS